LPKERRITIKQYPTPNTSQSIFLKDRDRYCKTVNYYQAGKLIYRNDNGLLYQVTNSGSFERNHGKSHK